MEKLREWQYDSDVEAYVFSVTSIDDPKLPKHWYGGTKALERDLYIGAFNHFPLEKAIEYMRTLNWKNPNIVQLIVMDDDDERFRIIDLFPTL